MTYGVGTGGQYANPLDQPGLPRRGSMKIQAALEKDNSGAAILNQAGDPVKNLSRDKFFPLATYTRNEPVYNPIIAQSYIDSVNSGIWIVGGLVCPARTAWLVDVSGEPQIGQIM